MYYQQSKTFNICGILQSPPLAMTQEADNIKRLTKQIENIVSRKISSPRDFHFLSLQIEGFTGERISTSTLKRIWGYTQSCCGFSVHSLDLLSRMAGYTCWDMFCGDNGEIHSSQFCINPKVFSKTLEIGEKMKLTWMPDRIIHIEYKGNGTFAVLQSQNSKLQAGDIFQCEQFMENEPLIMTHLTRKGFPPCDYICGKHGGIHWTFT